MHRRVYEIAMDKFVKPGDLHIIVATSALEAGVNIKAIDVVFVLSSNRSDLPLSEGLMPQRGSELPWFDPTSAQVHPSVAAAAHWACRA